MTATLQIKARLEQLRVELRLQQISYSELIELQGYGAAGQIEPDDVELLEAAGVSEFPETESTLAIDYADKIGARIRGDWLTDDSDFRSIEQMIAAGVREGYSLGFGAKP